MSEQHAGWFERLTTIERALGARAPDDYARFLADHSHKIMVDQVVTSNADYWGVGYFFELANGPPWAQLDEVFRLCGDVVPAGSLPIADDGFGNLILLSCAPMSIGQVAWWNHERGPNDDTVEVMAGSFTEFLSMLARAED